MTKFKNSGIIKAYAVPHPPIILPEIGQGRESEINDTIKSMQTVAREIAELAPDTIILTSPHAPLYHDAFFVSFSEEDSGDMSDFGFPQVGETLANDLELAELILAKAVRQEIQMVANKVAVNRLDHGSLVPLRFICAKYRGFKFLRLGLSGMDAATHYRLGQLIQESINELGRRVIFIASGDLSHVLKHDGPYGFREVGPKFDQAVTDILARAAFDELLTMPEELTEPAAQCGLPSFQIMAGAFDGRDVSGELLSYQGNLGVGYGVLRFNPRGDNPERSFLNLDKSDYPNNQDYMGQNPVEQNNIDPYVTLARETIESYIENGYVPSLSSITSDLPQEMLQHRSGAFVTLHIDGNLRGCIGTLEPYADSLALEIQKNAVSAATRDPRFPPLKKSELENLEVSVDVLSAPEKIESIDQLDPSCYGVIVSKGINRGVLLPDLDGVDTAQQQVEIALSKAGINKDEDYQLERFKVVRHE